MYRSQNTSFLKNALSEEYRLKRHRRFTISIQMTITSWLLEFLTGIITLSNAFIFGQDASHEMTTQILVGVHLVLYIIIIPGSYILSTEVYKALIFENGWSKLLPSRKKQKIAPAEIEEIELNIRSENDYAENRAAASIPTISGNVNLETSYKVY